jgi:hypothetical protein
VSEIRRIFTPGVAAALIALIAVCQVVALLEFARSYIERGRTIDALEDSLCRERLARIAATLLTPTDCRQAEKVLASNLPKIWTPIKPRLSPTDSAASVTRRPWRALWASPVSMSRAAEDP